MQIPIIVSRKKSNGQTEYINISSKKQSTFEKTFNPLVFKQLLLQKINQEQEHYESLNKVEQLRSSSKESKGRMRRISSSGVSKRFPKDFFKVQKSLQPIKSKVKYQLNNEQNQFLFKRKNSNHVDDGTQTPKFNEKANKPKSRLEVNSDNQKKHTIFSDHKIQPFDIHIPAIKNPKAKLFKIKSGASKKFLKKPKPDFLKCSQNMINNKQNKYPQSERDKQKIVSINGKKVEVKKDQNGIFRLKKILE